MASLGGPDVAPHRGRLDPRAVAVVAVAATCVLALALLSGQGLLTAEAEPDGRPASDDALAAALAIDAVSPFALEPGCQADGRVDLRCLDDGRRSPDEVEAPRVRPIPDECRGPGVSLDVGCLEGALGIDVPEGCRAGPTGVDVSCLAAARTVLTIDAACDDGGRFGPGCLRPSRYGLYAPEPARTLDDGFEPVPTTTDPRTFDTVEDPDPSPFLAWLLSVAARLLGAAVVGITLGLLVAWVLRSDWARARRGLAPRRSAAPLSAADEAHDRTVMAGSLAAGADELDLSGDPRAAIIAAYTVLLAGLEACAQGRRPAETPDEHLARVLGALDVRPEPLRRLTTLFGEARFSDHTMTEAQRETARAALGEAQADLARAQEPEPEAVS